MVFTQSLAFTRLSMTKLVAVVLLVAAVAVLVASAATVTGDVRAQFEHYVRKHERLYGAEEYERRLVQFAENLERIAQLQKLDPSAVYGVTKFADLHPDEFARLYLNKHKPDVSSLPVAAEVEADVLGDTPASWDWNAQGAVTPVKNQGQCGSCWAFSTTGNVEGVTYLASKKLPSLSEQQLVDCDKTDSGCEGGLPSQAFEYIIGAGGLMSEADYPYLAIDSTCRFDKSKVVASIANWTSVSTNEDQIAAYSYTNGPLSIGINAALLQFYVGGISDPASWLCNPKKLDHGVLITGWGVQGSKPYWIVKNSWGEGWGEKGFFRIIRGKGACGLNTMVTSAIVN